MTSTHYSWNSKNRNSEIEFCKERVSALEMDLLKPNDSYTRVAIIGGIDEYKRRIAELEKCEEIPVSDAKCEVTPVPCAPSASQRGKLLNVLHEKIVSGDYCTFVRSGAVCGYHQERNIMTMNERNSSVSITLIGMPLVYYTLFPAASETEVIVNVCGEPPDIIMPIDEFISRVREDVAERD